MKSYLSTYITYVLKEIESNTTDLQSLADDILVKINFMQHERLIHLIVLCLFAILFFISFSVFLTLENIGMLCVSVLMLVLLIPYIAHYYFLENNVQKLYYTYDEVIKKLHLNEK